MLGFPTIYNIFPIGQHSRKYIYQKSKVKKTEARILGLVFININLFMSYSLQISDLEKEKTMLEFEVKELVARHKSELSDRSNGISEVSDFFNMTGVIILLMLP